MPDDTAASAADPSSADVQSGETVPIAEQLVRLARTTGARVTFIEDPALLADAGGVGAMLRYRLQPSAAAAQPTVQEMR